MKKVFTILLTFIFCNPFCKGQASDFHWPSVKGDTFYVNKVKFKIRLEDTTKENVVIEKFENNKWKAIDSFFDAAKYIRSIDIDKNGFPDIAVWQKLSYDVYLFNPQNNIFVSSGEYSTRDLNDSIYYDLTYTGKEFDEQKMQLIDKDLGLFFDYQPEKSGQFVSHLFQIKNYKRIELGVIFQFAIYSERNKKYEPINGIIYKINNNQLAMVKENIVKTIERVGEHGFDYSTYWKNNWRKFLQ